MTDINVDLGDPNVPPYEMQITIKLPLVLDREALEDLMERAEELKNQFRNDYGHLVKK